MIRALFLLLAASSSAFAAAEDGAGQAVCCCVGVVIMILAAVGFSENRKKGAAGEGTQASPPQPAGGVPVTFQVRVVPSVQDFGGTNMECFSLKMRGPINLHPAQLTAAFHLTMWDITQGSGEKERKPVLCSIPQFQLKGTQVFLWTHVVQMPYAQGVLNDWADVLSIPVDTLTFPARGRRKLSFELVVSSLGIETGPVNRAECVHQHESSSYGYVDGIQQRIKTEELGLKLAAAVSAVDGQQDESEKSVVRRWMDSRIESLPENMRGDTTRALSRALMIAERLGKRLAPEEVPIMVEELVEQYPVANLPKGDLYDVVKLCMEVAAADGTAGPGELDLVNRISDLLGVDRDSFTKFRDKLLPASMHSEKDMEKILGLDPSWSAREKKKHLRGLYREWSSRVTHSDPKVRDQAEEMLKLIADERAKLDAEEQA
ncbi:MAG TPA: TerB family tellurite resistance protein [Candidatus Sabulitectum sp.]|nr:TerB family tellurite resistance protein [Candidatus Sabulitectum sp.]HPF32826.1 TerB family tellurite resistance protein [Candidatus Sabulitectum sp.]HPJ29259.1 TerB family tellurite resistance protein [Candidatus Sabulitectum sp.]HPR23415.1 TerB family tellurite resistance protein [Candidatus Sabulitectum sp.]